MISSEGGKYLAALIQGDVDEYIRLKPVDALFNGEEREAFLLLQKHVLNYGKIPERETLEEAGFLLPKVPEPSKFYAQRCEDRLLHQQMRKVMFKVQDLLKTQDPEQRLEARDLMLHFATKYTVHRHRHQVIEFGAQGLELVKQAYTQKILKGEDYGIRTGWPYLDELTHGLLPGDLFILVAKTGKGKTYLLLRMAEQAWHVHGKNVLVISMEMKPEPLLNRIAALHAHVPVTDLNKALMTSGAEKKLWDKLALVSDHGSKFYIVDGNLTATVDDITLLARQLNVDAVYVDGAYMLTPSDSKLQGWQVIQDTSRSLKRDLAGNLDVPVFATYQFKGNQHTQKKQGQDLGLGDIAHSQEIQWIASVVLGITEEEDADTVIKKRVDILKGRNGEEGHFHTNWIFDNWPYMDFSQWVEPTLENFDLS